VGALESPPLRQHGDRAREGLIRMPPLLVVEKCSKRFGGLVANRDVSLAIDTGEIVGLIGPNGAGKTTLFNCISGALHPDEGLIALDGTDISRARPERVCHLGIARTWQVVRSFGRMTVLENVMCGALRRTNRTGHARTRALGLMAFTGLADKADIVAAGLTLADKKRLEITRALATEPRLLLLDEAMSGLTPLETTAAVDLVRRIHGELGLAICVVEHVMEVVMPLSHRVVVLDRGEKLTEGRPEDIARDERVITAYLGERYRGRA
jgi:branched-chain amino acid transport system ATP-binding protein